MSVSHLKRKSQWTFLTLMLVGTLIISGLVVALWFAGEHRISEIFEQVNNLQQRPPMWLEVPMVMREYLLAPTVALFIVVLAVMRVSPQPRTWSRRIVVGILIILTLRYVTWRCLSTLNLVNPLNGVFSLGLFALEMVMLVSTTIQLFLMLNVKDRKRDADRKSLAVIDGSFNPTVDIFIPTYSEPTFILRRTIIGCQALDYPNKKIYLLDDTRRQEMAELAQELQCEYITRTDNLYAKAGGFVTESLSEDYFTGIRLSAKGYRLIYLDEKLSAGLAAENIAAHATQRLRWARGTLQGLFIKSNPLTIPGLNLIQRLAHLEGLLHWFTSISRVYFLIMPLTYSFLGVIPIKATPAELLYFFLPYYLVNLAVFAWLNNHARSALLSDIYSLVLCFPLALTVIQVMLNPFSKGFKVTPKGTVNKSYTFNWKLALPLIFLFIVTAMSLWRNLGMCMIQGVWAPVVDNTVKGIGLGWLWSTYNLIMIGIALLILLDAPKPDIYEWFDLRRVVKLTIGDNQTLWGVTTIISEGGAEIALTQTPFDLPLNSTVHLEIAEENLQLGAEIIQTGFNNEYRTLRVKYTLLSLTQHRRLVKMLFCRPGQWKRNKTPGEFQSFLLIFRILLKPRVFFDRNIDINPVAVTKL